MRSQKTTLIKNTDIVRNWHELDASAMSLGRLATAAARFLIGKNKVHYSPHQDLGDYVVVINADDIKLTSKVKKSRSKIYHRYSGYPGGLSSETLGKRLEKNPELVVRNAVRGMIDDNRLRKARLRRLHIVKGSSHNFPTPKK